MSSPRRSVDLDGLSEEHARAVESIVAALRARERQRGRALTRLRDLVAGRRGPLEDAPDDEVERIALEAVAEVRVELP